MADCCVVQPQASAAPGVMPCPRCGSRSKKVDALTVKSLVRRLPFDVEKTQFYFCASPNCDVVYFGPSPAAPTFYRQDLLVRIGVKEQQDPIPVCYCFGISRKDIRDEIEQTGKSTVASRIGAEVRAGNCACEVKNPSGKCCLGEVTRTVQEALRVFQALP